MTAQRTCSCDPFAIQGGCIGDEWAGIRTTARMYWSVGKLILPNVACGCPGVAGCRHAPLSPQATTGACWCPWEAAPWQRCQRAISRIPARLAAPCHRSCSRHSAAAALRLMCLLDLPDPCIWLPPFSFAAEHDAGQPGSTQQQQQRPAGRCHPQ